jgi:hypothetical protein
MGGNGVVVGRPSKGMNSFDEGLSLELLGELVLVGMLCFVKMGLDEEVDVGREIVEFGVNTEDLGSRINLGTKFAAVGFSLVLLSKPDEDTSTPPRTIFFSSSARGGRWPSPVVVIAVSADDCTTSTKTK